MGMRAARSRRSFVGWAELLSCLAVVACGPAALVEDAGVVPSVGPSGTTAPSEGTSPDKPLPVEVPSGDAPTEAPEVPTGRSWIVSTKGRDDAAGTREAPLRTVGRAVALASPGELIQVLSGVYAEEFIFPALGAGKPSVFVRGEGSPLPTFAPGNTDRSTVVRVQGRWKLENLRVDVGGHAMTAVLFESGSDGAALSGSELRSGTASAGVVVSGPRGVTLERNNIHHFIKPEGDSHGVVVVGPSRDIVIRDNELHHNSGDSVQCQAGSGGQPATSLRIERNTMHDEGENGVDIKLCAGVLVRGNTITSLPNTAIRAAGSSAGEGVVIHLAARDVTVQNNTIARTGRGISILQDAAPPENIRVEGNQLDNLRNLPEGNGFGIRVEGGRGVVVVGNTVTGAANYALMFAADGKALSGLEVRENTARGSSGALLLRLGPEAHRPGLVLRGNRYSLGGVLKADGVAARLEGALSSYLHDFPGERLTLSTADKLQVWRQVVGVDTGSSVLE